MYTRTLQQIPHRQRDIFWATIIIIFILISCYIGFLSKSMINVSIRQDTNDKIVVLRSKVAQLEFQYVALQNTVTTETALSKGYIAQAPIAYVTKESRLSLARP
jgi:hypothetical protein